ncbi:diguanylate cyclase/phosphodiesterase [Enhygromyxa salina]|uniref:Diguanylate cyclase/phosphodiesterase n=1 Tax=Enhygromyxa salina TaxID=215803 RepID=A0A0C1ZM95_9BACT|nr:hypothetical protein [Enhygromyxa salina]KIG12063.1 diguanylate cyclase/phosphodiesterase [Enhygromyxa salina]
MWSERERDELAVWADRLQAEGEPLGELVGTSLLAEAVAQAEPNTAAPAHRYGHKLTRLRDRVRELEASVRDPIIAELFTDYPELEPSWEHGMIVALRVVDRPGGSTFRAVDPVRKLLRLPVARFLRHIRVDARASGHGLHVQIPALLAEPGVVARPWSVVLGRAPRHLRRQTRLAALDPHHQGQLRALVDPERGLRSLFLDGVRIALPWQPGDKGARKRAAASLADRPTPASTETSMTRLSRALWDPSVRVRLQIIGTLPLIGTDAAAFVAELLLVERGELEWLTRVREVLDTLARNPKIVSAVALNFTADQTRCASWLAASPLAVAHQAVPRIEAMLACLDARDPGPGPAPGPGPRDDDARRELSAALATIRRRHDERLRWRSFDGRNPTARPLLTRLRRWLHD